MPVRDGDSLATVGDRAIAYLRIPVRIAGMELHRPATGPKKVSGGVDDGVRDAKGVEDGPTPATSSPPAAERVSRSVGETAERAADCPNGGNVSPGRSISHDNNIFKMPLLFTGKVLFQNKRFYQSSYYLGKFTREN